MKIRKIKDITLINTITSIILQIITLLNGFIVPKIILTYFGSDVNGLISSITQFLGYIYLVEGGITGVLMASLYKPLYNNDSKKIASIVKTSKIFYKKISVIFVIYTLLLSIVYPLIINSNFSFWYIFSLIIILSISLLIQYTLSITFRTLLNADKKVYIVSITQSIILILNILLSIISIKIYPSIHFLKLLSGLIYIIQPLVYTFFVNKYYTIDKNAEIDNELLKNRWSGFAINVASFIHFNTDMVILNLFTNLKIVSVYAVYNLVISGLRQIINSISSAIYPTIGHVYAKGDNKELNEKFNIYELIIFYVVFVIFTVAFLLITPFVSIYTENIKDVNYSMPLLGYILIIAEMLYLIRSPHVNLAYSANKFKEMTIPAIIEASINIIISIILVNIYGIIGVAIGTLIAMLYRTIYQIYFLKKEIIKRNVILFYKKSIIFGITFISIIAFIHRFILIKEFNILNFILYGIIYLLISIVLYSVDVLIFYKEDIHVIIKKRRFR